MALDAQQSDLDRALDEIASGDDAVTLDIGLKKMMEFLKRSHGRCDDIERAAKTIASLKEDYVELRNRLVPFAAAQGGVANRMHELRDARDGLQADIDALLQTPEGTLAERVQRFAHDKNTLDRRLSEMNEEFSKLAMLRKDIAGTFTSFHRALDVLAISKRGDNDGDVDARVEELTTFIAATQAQINDIERRLVTFGQLKSKLYDVQTRLLPLESKDGGVVSVIDDLKEIRDTLIAKIRYMEESEDGDLTERVKKFTETRRELEERVSMLTEQFLKLAAVRKDIAGLFDKLGSAVSASANWSASAGAASANAVASSTTAAPISQN
jgi:uncharacterized coiled-coil DUF342 family protein